MLFTKITAMATMQNPAPIKIEFARNTAAFSTFILV
jgi:hypothetical protein